MHGLIHKAFKDFIIKNFGFGCWSAILAKSGIDDDSTILEMRQYGDDVTFAAIGIACHILKIDPPDALELFGAFLVDYAVASGFCNQLASLGKDFFDLLTNLNLLHHHLERDFRSSIFPVFVIESKSENNDVFQVRYSSMRIGLEGLVRGVLRKIARDMFHANLTFVVVKTPEFRGVPRMARDGEDTSIVLDLHVELLPTPPPGAESLEATSASKSIAFADFSFFDFHAFLVSCCQTMREEVEMVVSEQVAWETPASTELLIKEVALAAVCNPAVTANVPLADRIKIAHILFKGVAAGKVASAWKDVASMEKASQFWSAYDKLDEFYTWSHDIFGQDCVKPFIAFLSHSWKPPGDWEAAMGTGTEFYASIKAAEICGFAKDVAASKLGDPSIWPDVQFWVDKCCIPQGHQVLMDWCVNLIEEFIVLSDRLVVILSWSYFERLWCVYEWVCFLVHHKPSSITLCADAFIRSCTLSKLINSIRNFSLANCKCLVESDRELLSKKVETYYVSHAAFETFLKFSAIALIARDMAIHRIALGEAAVLPWMQLAKDCGFDDLALCLTTLAKELPKWRLDSTMGQGQALRLDMQTAIFQQVESWFSSEIDPLIEARRSGSVRREATEISLQMALASTRLQ
mmetsp:Transcript_106884/g.300533  ORF Transcript_106884/g.300533 Transcript_106884/m.300533 type:complete len:633 (-) Transcript_106884:33-1931(-)